jgi:hypothetical protein
MSKRSAAWYVREIEKRNRERPGEPIRFDVTGDELSMTAKAYTKLVFPESGEVVGWRYHPGIYLEDRELFRVAFMSSQNASKPMKVIPVPYRKDREAWLNLAALKKKQLQDQYGYEYHVEIDMSGGAFDKTALGGPVCEVWRGEDWLRVRYFALYPGEIARALDAGVSRKFAVKIMQPDYETHQKNKKSRQKAMKETNKKKISKSEEQKVFIRKKYKALEPQIQSKEKNVSEVYDLIQNAFEIVYAIRPSFSKIDRALGKKK